MSSRRGRRKKRARVLQRARPGVTPKPPTGRGDQMVQGYNQVVQKIVDFLKQPLRALVNLATLLSLFVASLSWQQIAVVLVALLAVNIVWSLRFRRHHLVRAGAVVAALMFVVVAVFIPTHRRTIVEACVDETMNANIWLGRAPVSYQSSADYMVDHYEAFDPETWHGWNDLLDVEVVPSMSIVKEPSLVRGRAVLFAGVVNGSNDFGGGEWIVQLLPLSTTDENYWSMSKELSRVVPDPQQRSTLLESGGLEDAGRSKSIIYVRIFARPFFQPRTGDLWTVKGVTLAYGQTLQGGNQFANVGYVVGSSAEKFTPRP